MLVQEQDILLAEGRRLENEHKMTCMMLDKIYANIHSVSYSKEWKEKIHAFQRNIEMRAECLFMLKQNENSFEL